MKKRFLSILLMLCMLLSIVPLTPVMATAETVTPTTVAKDITLGYSALHDADTENAKWDYVYFGTYNNDSIKWRVLSTNGNTTTATNAENGPVTNTATYKTAGDAEYTGKALFMLSENTLFDTKFDETSNRSNNYSESTLRSKMQNDIFESTSNELKYVLKTTKIDDSETIGYINSNNEQYSRKWDASTLSDDTLFALSAREVEQYLGSGEKYANRKSGNAAWWWLRSPLANYPSTAGVIYYDGVVYLDFVDDDDYGGARPALNLNLSSVLFTSAAKGGKSSNAVAGGVTENKNYGDIENNDGYKLTLLDESRSGFSAYLKSLSGNTATVSYSGAKTGTNEYISVIIKNRNDVKYYGRVCEVASASGDVDITLPADYSTANGDVLCVFNEQYNGNYKTDYASDLVVLPDYRWYTNDTTKTEFTISTVSELVGFANLVNGTNLPSGVSGHVNFSGKTVKLANDINLNSITNWTPISKDGSDFRGTFDGNNKTISNLTVNSNDYYVGLFGRICEATVKDLAVSGNVTGTAEDSDVGGIVGELTNGSITNCSFSGNVTGNGRYVGGIVGSATGTILKCRNYAAVSGNAHRLGGIVGFTRRDVQYCYNQGSVTSKRNDAYVGGIAGHILAHFSITVDSCYNTGTVSATLTSAYVGGVVGFIEAEVNVTIDDFYYLDSDSVAVKGIGSAYVEHHNTITGEAVAKSSTAFSSGEVAWLLQNAADEADGLVWGQTLNGSDKDDYPVFANENGSNKVYKVTYKVDGKADQIEYVNGGTISVSNPIAPNGYTFGGWYTAQTGGTQVTTITEDITLYARFTPDTYTVTYNAGENGTGTVTAGSKTHGVDFTLSSETFTRTGYTQTGWATSDGGDKVYDLGGKYTADADITLYPVWKANQYTITFDPNGGTVDPTSATTDVEGKLTELPTPTRSGSYRFDGWFTEKNGGTAVTVDTVYAAHTTVYAHWTCTGSTIPDYYVIKATAGEGGSISPSGRAAVLYGGNKTFTITPNDGYAIADVKVDGKSIGAVKTYTFERVRGDHTIEAVFMKATGNPQTGVDVPFTDVSENDWFYADVAYVYANDLMNGTSATTFSPDVTTTRGMIVTILYRLEGEPAVADNCPFEDVKSGSYYEKAITWAAENEIVGGYDNGKFGPDDPITREQMAVILYRYTQYKGMDVSVGEDTNILSYHDALEISEYAFSAMQWICGESILNGSDGNLMPQGNATRAQVAAILHRFCENILK